MTRYLFLGERPSKRAEQIGACWENGKLAACTLHAALRACGVDPADCLFGNLWPNADPLPCDTEQAWRTLYSVRDLARSGVAVVGMGKLVQAHLHRAGIPHIPLRHPAARGAGRRRDLYQRHVKAALEANP